MYYGVAQNVFLRCLTKWPNFTKKQFQTGKINCYCLKKYQLLWCLTQEKNITKLYRQFEIEQQQQSQLQKKKKKLLSCTLLCLSFFNIPRWHSKSVCLIYQNFKPWVSLNALTSCTLARMCLTLKKKKKKTQPGYKQWIDFFWWRSFIWCNRGSHNGHVSPRDLERQNKKFKSHHYVGFFLNRCLIHSPWDFHYFKNNKMICMWKNDSDQFGQLLSLFRFVIFCTKKFVNQWQFRFVDGALATDQNSWVVTDW